MLSDVFKFVNEKKLRMVTSDAIDGRLALLELLGPLGQSTQEFNVFQLIQEQER